MITTFVGAIFMSFMTILLFIVYYFTGRKDEKKEMEAPIIAMVFLCIAVITISLVISEAIEKRSFSHIMRVRLNQPVVSGEQLYGYKITAKRQKESLEDSSSSLVCLIDIKDLLGENQLVLKDIEVEKEFFSELELGGSFPPSIDPNEN